MTVAEFLAWEEGQEGRWEFDGFAPVAMVGGTRAHSLLQTNLITALSTRVRPPCFVYNNDLRLEVAGSVRYPDVYVACGVIANDAKRGEEPRVVFEVLSPSTAGMDQIVKNAEYRATPSIRRYVMLAQDGVGATVFERQGEAWVGSLVAGLEGVLEMPEIGVAVPLREVYRGVVEAA